MDGPMGIEGDKNVEWALMACYTLRWNSQLNVGQGTCCESKGWLRWGSWFGLKQIMFNMAMNLCKIRGVMWCSIGIEGGGIIVAKDNIIWKMGGQ